MDQGKGIILGTPILSFPKLGLIDKLLLEHVGLLNVLDLAVNLVNFLAGYVKGVILTHFYYLHFFTRALLHLCYICVG